MANKAVFHAVHETCCRCMDENLLFGGKVVVLLGDFRQTAPVIRGGTRHQLIDASIKSSPLWPSVCVMTLTEPIRNTCDLEYATFVDDIGEGRLEAMPLNMFKCTTTPTDIIDFVYPRHILDQPLALNSRAILAATNHQVDLYNDQILQMLPGNSHFYMSANSLKEAEDNDMLETSGILDYVARHSPHGMPAHSVQVKIGGVYRLLRNFSVERGLVKNARVLISGLGNHIIAVRLLEVNTTDFSPDPDNDILIPRICFTSDLPSGHTLLCRQFPLGPSYATTFNSCQGLTLSFAGIDLTYNVFSYGQLYTALSHIKHRDHLMIRLHDLSSTVPNVTLTELLL